MSKKIYTIKVIPRAKENKLIEQTQNYLKIKLKAIPEKGLANKELIKVLSQFFKVPKNNIEILAGHASKVKIVKICV